ncbi:hypothetical protein A4G20_10670 [Pasteurellaceae bacterium RH1A]|nr:hypothetical protein A4G20_10670 [Pasteurellaceae bacterium RH1A]
MHKVYLQQANAWIGQPMDDKSLRQALKEMGIDARRLSRFTQLALLGALPLKPYLTADTPIYLGSPFNSPSKFNKLFQNLMGHNLPSPLDFMANINNAATFHLAEQLGIRANSLFLSVNGQTFLQPLELACLDLQEHSSVLVGWVLEDNEQKEEGYVWWLVSSDQGKAIEGLEASDLPFITQMKDLART